MQKIIFNHFFFESSNLRIFENDYKQRDDELVHPQRIASPDRLLVSVMVCVQSISSKPSVSPDGHASATDPQVFIVCPPLGVQGPEKEPL